MIELGEYGGLATSAGRAEEPSEPSPRRSRRPDPGWLAHRRQLVHRATAALLVVVCLLGLSSSAHAGLGLDRPNWAIQQVANSFGIGGDNVYLVDTGVNQVTARDLDTGEVRWRIQPIETAVSVADMGHGVVGIHTHARVSSGLASSSGIVLVSEATGEVLLEYIDLGPTVTIGERLILKSNQPAIRGDCADEATVCTDLAAFDLRAGREAWRTSVPLDSFVAPVTHPG